MDKNSFTCLLSHFQFQLCLRPRFLLLFGLIFKSVDVMILLHLNNNGSIDILASSGPLDVFPCMFLKLNTRVKELLKKVSQMKWIHYIALKSCWMQPVLKGFFFLSPDVLIFSAFFFLFNLFPQSCFFSTGSLRQTANGRVDYTITNLPNNSKSKAVLCFSDFLLSKNLALKPALIHMSRLMMLNLIIVKTEVPKASLSKILGSCDPPF